jgi:hypothetical protein
MTVGNSTTSKCARRRAEDGVRFGVDREAVFAAARVTGRHQRAVLELTLANGSDVLSP